MTEEERIEWAKNYKRTEIKKATENVLASSGKALAKARLVGRENNRKRYANPELRAKYYGDKQNAKTRYLYQHNEEFRELKKFRVAFRKFRNKKYEYDGWVTKYYAQYKDKMDTHASTFKLEGTQNYVHGLTLKDLSKFSPISLALMKSFITQGIFPAPKYRGYKHTDKGLSKEVEEFYLVSEVEAYLNIFARYRKKFSLVKSDEQKLYLKKNFWTQMKKARENFDNG